MQVHLDVDLFSTVNTTVLHHPWLVASEDEELQRQRDHGYGHPTITLPGFLTAWRVSNPNPLIVQRSPVLTFFSSSSAQKRNHFV